MVKDMERTKKETYTISIRIAVLRKPQKLTPKIFLLSSFIIAW